MSVLSVQKISASREGIKVLESVSIEVPTGTMTALIGPNGVGKSTLLACISGLLKPDCGKVIFDGTDLTTLPPHRIFSMGVVQVPEGRGIFKRMSVKDNLLVPTLNQHWKVYSKRLERIYELFPILKKRELQQASLLSGGEQQMLTIGRALMGSPTVLLLDEPTLGLAPLVLTDIIKALRDLLPSGLGILLVEQNAMVALRESDYGYVMDRGRIVMDGEGRLLLENSEIKSSYLGLQELHKV
jgi:branched-chain amino acid transport system ATP-binding protein